MRPHTLSRLDSGQEGQLAARKDAGLKAGAIGFVDGLSIGLASTAPAYSLAAVIGTVVAVVGVQAPAARAHPGAGRGAAHPR